MALAHTDLFALMAEVSAAFVGFSLVIGLLQPSHPGAAVRLNIMRAVAELAMISGGGAILVLILHEFGMSSEAVWRCASLVVGLVWFALHSFAVRRLKSAGASWYTLKIVRLGPVLAFSGMLMMLWNVILPSENSSARYLATLFLALIGSAFLFIVATFRFGPDEEPPAD
jgi:hypothetical protein